MKFTETKYGNCVYYLVDKDGYELKLSVPLTKKEYPKVEFINFCEKHNKKYHTNYFLIRNENKTLTGLLGIYDYDRPRISN